MSDSTPSETVILVHGLWMTGLELGVLHKRLETEHGFRCERFSYHSVTGSMQDHVQRLRELAEAQRCERLHFVGHSLGGIVILKLLETARELLPGRAVFLGSPLQGSRAAESMVQWKLGRMAMGDAVYEELMNGPPRVWDGRRDVGVIAGSFTLGLGRLLSKALATDSDGTVCIDETLLPGAADHLVMDVTHTGMVFSSTVADQVAAFLRTGKFARS